MLYTVGYRGYTIWRESDRNPFNISRTESRDRTDLERFQITDAAPCYDFGQARREVDYLKRA